MKTNRDNLVEMSVMGEISHPAVRSPSPYRISASGEPMVLPATAGITYNVRVGDSATRWVADHLEPAVTIRNRTGERSSGDNAGLNILACIGNAATVISGKAEGETGTVTGKHGGAEHVIVDFTREAMEKMAPGDKILVRSRGLGLSFEDYPDVGVFNLDPDLLDAWGIEEEAGTLRIPVTHTIPSAVMGSGLGQDNTFKGDYDITLFDEDTVGEYRLDQLRLGDMVAIIDADHRFGRIFRRGFVSFGIVIHGGSIMAGHGPGVTSLVAGSADKLIPVVDSRANIASILELRDDV
ncbi:MAG: DUF4438 domain-containing protein [Clostridia bacterium]